MQEREKKREKESMKQRHFVAAVITLVDREIRSSLTNCDDNLGRSYLF